MRRFSFAQESSRYCNYGNDKKFGKELTFINPSWIDYDEMLAVAETLKTADRKIQNAIFSCILDEVYDTKIEEEKNEAIEKRNEIMMVYSMYHAEQIYMYLIEHGYAPQQARHVLPTMIKSEICVTGFESDWRFFFDLRLFGKTGSPHTDMLRVAEIANKRFEEVGYWEDIMKYQSKFDAEDFNINDELK